MLANFLKSISPSILEGRRWLESGMDYLLEGLFGSKVFLFNLLERRNIMKSLIKSLLFLVLTLGLTFGIAEQGYSQAPIVIKLGNVQATADIVQTGLKKFADLVNERTKGQIQVQVFPASQLGTEQELLEGVQLGSIHMFEGSTGSVGRFLIDLEAFAAPYIWRDPDHMLKVVRGPIGQGLAERLVKAKGIRVLDFG
jgi:TRAP-type C4-dicarboxylate transport system substrate-binding protein